MNVIAVILAIKNLKNVRILLTIYSINFQIKKQVLMS